MKREFKILTAIIVIAIIIAAVYVITRPPAPFVPGWVGPIPEERIKIGVIGPMAFIQGKHHWYGAWLAAEEINAQGGVKIGEEYLPIELVKIDSNEILSPEVDAPTAAEKAITVDKVDFLVGGFRTEGVFAMQEVAMEYGKIFIGCGASTDELCTRVGTNYDKYKYWFRVTPLRSTVLAGVDFMLVGHVGTKVVENLGIEKPKVAVLAEEATWADAIVEAATEKVYVPGFTGLLPVLGYVQLGPSMEVVGIWRPSDTATDVTSELADIQDKGAHIIFTTLSGPVGIPYGKQWGELEIPAASVGINVEAQKRGFWDATGGMGNYEMTMNTYARVEITPATIPFYDNFVGRFGEYPTYNAGTYEATYLLAESITRADTLDADALVIQLEKVGTTDENQIYRPNLKDGVGTAGKLLFNENHDVTWAADDNYIHRVLGPINPKAIHMGLRMQGLPGLVTAIGTQWRDGELKCVWPDNHPLFGTYPGTVSYELPPRMT